MFEKTRLTICSDPKQTPYPWYALRVQQKFEHLIQGLLCEKGYECYVPEYESVRQWSDRRKTIRLPLIPGYVFCRLEINQRLGVLMTPRVQYVVGLGKVPVAIDDEEMDAVRRVVESGRNLGAHPYLQVGDRVRVERGALAGLEGILMQVKTGARIVVSIPLLQRSISTEIEMDAISPVRTQRPNSSSTSVRLAS